MDVLVLNATYEPLQIQSLRKALKLLLKGAAVEVLRNTNGEFIRSANVSVPKPSVIKLIHYVSYHHNRKPVAFSKKNIMIRDNYTCQYCLVVGTKMTIDHVVPQEKGGETTWENTVTCCQKCNTKKANLDLWDTDMVLNRIPRRPIHLVFLRATAKRPEWHTYMFI
jgi:5-methylcytosine-specific restriction endonuclease McrA